MPAPVLKSLEEAQREIENYKAQLDVRDARIEELSHQLAVLRKALFGSRSEKSKVEDENTSQLNLFDAPAEDDSAEADEEVNTPAHKRKKKGGRKPLPPELPREEVIHDVAEEDKVCSCGCAKHRMGEDVTEELETIPAQVFVRRHVRPKYVCRHCSGSIVQAPLPERPIPRCQAGPGFLAHMIVSKYADHIPLCRMERILARGGIDITRSNMSEWAMRLHQLCKPLIALILSRILESAVIHSDDTPIRVQQPGGGIKKSYLWVYLGDETAPYTFYDFTERRTRAGPSKILSDFSGFLQADAYTGYEELYKLVDDEGDPRIREAACWAHTRRYFVQAVESGDELARHAVAEIAKLYGVEKRAKEDCKDKSRDELHAHRLKLRRKESVEVIDGLFAWMDERFDVLPRSPLGKALTYAQNNKAALYTYTTDGRLDIDNNAAERALRPIAVGRKNWLFAGSNQGGHAAATFFTLIESARRNGTNPFEYLQDLFTRLPGHNIQRLEELLPDRWLAARE